MSRVYVPMDTIQNVNDPNVGIHVPPSGACDDCTIFEHRLTDVENELPNKQDKLTAGTNITIVGNVISASGGGGSVVIDNALSPTSTNPVQNKVINSALATKQDTLTAGTNVTIVGNTISATDTTYDAATAVPLMDGVATTGSSVKYAREDHVHPTDTSRQATIKSASVAIAAGDWSSKTAVKTVTGVTSSNKVLVTYAPASKDAYLAADIYCSSQGSNSLTFKCTTTPSASVTANVMIID